MKRFREAATSPSEKHKPVFGEDKTFKSSGIESYLKALDLNLGMMAEKIVKTQKVHLFLVEILQDSTSSFKMKVENFLDTIGKKTILLNKTFDDLNI